MNYVRFKSLAAVLVALGFGLEPAYLVADPASPKRADKLEKIDHFVVIYQENHSFDNLYGAWEGVNGLSDADTSHITQINQAGSPFGCLKQNDPNLTSPPLIATCAEATNGIASAFTNGPFKIDDYIPATANTCPNGAAGGTPGGCTRDLVHRFYQEQYQLNGGNMNRYVTGSDAIGLVMGYYDTTLLPVYKYLHEPAHPHYAVADSFFQAAFGGSFLNHQWLIAANTPVFANAVKDGSANDLHSIIDGNDMPNTYPLYAATGTVKDSSLTEQCPTGYVGKDAKGFACGDYAINTIQPTYQPYSPGTAIAKRLPPLSTPTIGDLLSGKSIDWAWYSGGWSNADGDIGAPGWTNGDGSACSDPNTIAGATAPNCPDKLFQFHHQAFNYYANYAPGKPARKAHLRDEAEFLQLAQASAKECKLKAVSFVKPLGAENEHPGYASESRGSDHLVDLIKAVEDSACATKTMIIVTYDEFGGAWDHVPPPGQGNDNGPHDQWGPGTRIPALVISPFLRGDFVVDHTPYDTTSILATIEHRYRLDPLGYRDANVHDLSAVFAAHQDRIGNDDD